MNIEKEIRESYALTGKDLAHCGSFGDSRWYGYSQYGYELTGPFATKKEAEQSVLGYYMANPNLIMQWLK